MSGCRILLEVTMYIPVGFFLISLFGLFGLRCFFFLFIKDILIFLGT